MMQNNENANNLNDISFFARNKKKIITAGFVLLFFIVLDVVFLIEKYNKKDLPAPTQETAKVATSSLPQSDITAQVDAENDNFNNVKAETLFFAGFYEKMKDAFVPKADPLKLPIHTKSSVSNYYDISRKINLDSKLSDIDKNGFAILENPFPAEADNFYSMYAALDTKEIPQLLTSDFLLYYYQNLSKELFDEIKKNAFYRELWKIDKAFFEIASNRYKKNKLIIGDANNPVLEGQRLEAAYFAVSLELLKPKMDQINKEVQLVDENKFSAKEVQEYNFELPDYLKDDVTKELKLILEANKVEKSPVMLYPRDYASFVIPSDVKDNAKLSNFSLAINWKKAVFPLYFKDVKCENCLLDKNDWAINQIAATYIAKDFSENQELKNRWARIYKVVSYFSGLRKDLTYLHYNEALENQFGKDLEVEEIYSQEVDKSVAAGLKIQNALNKVKFSELEGSYNRQENKNLPMIGMRLLQESYWPDNYIFEELTKPKVSAYTKNVSALMDSKLNNTRCTINGLNAPERCNGIGLDIINLISPISDNKYFLENTAYKNYPPQVEKIKKQLANFDVYSWHNNNYWTILDIQKTILDKNSFYAGPINSETPAWKEKQLNTALGTWVNLRLPSDKLVNAVQKVDSFGSTDNAEILIEPNLNLVNELSANSKMLSKMLYSLRVISQTDYSAKKLGEFSEELDKIILLVKKELNGEEFDLSEQQFLSSMLRKLTVEKTGNKVAEVKINNQGQGINESIEGIKLLLVVYQKKDKKIILAGPVFNYSEARFKY
ncbi:MAG: hypothetical protein UT48_C0020G0007 [Parcubacteria group bacterium GW2011_GWE2_39_37]|uniref:Uncharacterized protein n=1 Tax=Candidatus Falkowbacteria bacterium GW2011_GWF2_39_8 TaxID=1618642 RepID=A0A0G0T6H7_9BACT|nr:MAG: hypothetical protein UT48_C0020G0007 [Parcubacteria group bacterium GW2011_GWE2_39_37]KKR33447.1 MAG: hypothetical protein UT64_C0008G0002 [Candidatus Falkowbacteria bacterium GW2011_GWF2_39_8]